VIIIAGWVEVPVDERDRYLEERRDKTLRIRELPGCLVYTLSADSIEPGRVRIFECWHDQAAIDARHAQERTRPAESFAVRVADKAIVSYEATSSVVPA
jgi:quinol monooxygenase YgiN